MDELTGTFEMYQILAKLGQGTSGTVYKVFQSRFNRIVALKTPLIDSKVDCSLRNARFRYEVQALAYLDCRPGGSIPACQRVSEHNGLPFYQREFVEGETLEHLVAKKSIQLKEAVLILASIAQTVQWIHEKQFVHRNLHASNILVSVAGPAKLIGFGQVCYIEPPAAVRDGRMCVSTDTDVQSLQKTLDWLCFFLRQPVPPRVESLRYGELPSTAGAFADLLRSSL
jgi:serine/threonine protein kinase